jgi:hypothetical protein
MLAGFRRVPVVRCGGQKLADARSLFALKLAHRDSVSSKSETNPYLLRCHHNPAHKRVDRR